MIAWLHDFKISSDFLCECKGYRSRETIIIFTTLCSPVSAIRHHRAALGHLPSSSSVIIIITRPRPASGRLGLGRSLGGYTVLISKLLTPRFAPAALNSERNNSFVTNRQTATTANLMQHIMALHSQSSSSGQSTFIMIIISFQLLALPRGEFQVGVQWEQFGNLGKNVTYAPPLYISSTWQGKAKSANMRHTLHHYIHHHHHHSHNHHHHHYHN